MGYLTSLFDQMSPTTCQLPMTAPPATRHENEIVDQDGDVTMHDAVFERKSAIKRHPAAYKKHVRFELEDPDVAMQDVNDTDVDTIS